MFALTNNQQRFAELSNTNILNSTECRLNQKPLLAAPLKLRSIKVVAKREKCTVG